MSALQTAVKQELQTEKEPVVNDFSITVGTVNGSGSQTSNLTLLRALFKMGIPVSGKNLFPSNIQGLPTWYTIRVSKDCYLARREEHEIVVAMNPATFVQDLADVKPGGAFYYADDIRLKINRDDISAYPMPVKEITRAANAPASLRDYIANMVYVGVVIKMLGIDMDKIYQALDFHFKGKAKPIDLNFRVIQAAYNWAEQNLVKTDPYRVEAMDATSGFIMADGNTAARWDRFTAACSWSPGIRLLRLPVWPNLSTNTCQACARTRKLVRTPSQSCRRKMSWLPSVWRLALDGRACGP